MHLTCSPPYAGDHHYQCYLSSFSKYQSERRLGHTVPCTSLPGILLLCTHLASCPPGCGAAAAPQMARWSGRAATAALRRGTRPAGLTTWSSPQP